MPANFKEISQTFSILTPKKVSYNRVTNPVIPSSLFWPRYIQITWVAKSAHQTAGIHWWHVRICPNVTPRLVSRNEILYISVNSLIAKWWRLAPHWRLLQIACQARGRKRCKSVGLTLTSSLVNDYGTTIGRFWTTLPAVPLNIAFVAPYCTEASKVPALENRRGNYCNQQ
jgi:hypothetical protein